jgi:arabinose-5-phosphate isomerase
MLVDSAGRFTGLFTDSDLARILEQRDEHSLDEPISSRMTRDPIAAQVDWSLQEAMAVFSHHRISELPVIDDEHSPVGLVDITDLVSLTDQPREKSTLPFQQPKSFK